MPAQVKKLQAGSKVRELLGQPLCLDEALSS